MLFRLFYLFTVFVHLHNFKRNSKIQRLVVVVVEQRKLPGKLYAKIEDKGGIVDSDKNDDKRANGAINHAHVAASDDHPDGYFANRK